jgi:2-phospho-L-lactate transferase/gluconeogenesis factor (CofD/UPF0052 family)
MTQPGETDGFNIEDHVDWISRALGRNPDYLVINNGKIPETVLSNYNEQGANPLYLDQKQELSLGRKGVSIMASELFTISDEDVIRHNGTSVSEILMKICRDNNEGA